jgi:TP901 family phage tail tape measure protein
MSSAGGNIPLNVRVTINTTGARQATNSMRAVTGASMGMSRGLGQSVISMRTLGDATRQSASLLKYTFFGAALNVGKSALQMSRNFEITFARIKGLVNVGTAQMEIFKKSVLSLAGETGRAPLELADALYFVTSAGIKDARALEVLESSAKASAAGLGETKIVADAVTSTLNAYGKGAYSAAEVTDILVATVREGKAEADTFAPALGKVLPVAAAFGASFEDVSASVAALSRTGLSAGTSAIYIRQVLSQLLKPSKQAEEALLGVGTSAEEIRKNVAEQGLFPALEGLNQKLDGNAAVTAKVFGNVRALTAVLALLGPNADANEEIFRKLNNAGGDLDYAFTAVQETLDMKFNKAFASSQAAMIKLGDSLKGVAVTLLNFQTAVTGTLTSLFGADNAFGSLTRTTIKVVAGLSILGVVFTGLLRTGSSIIRLYSNMTVAAAGFTRGVMLNGRFVAMAANQTGIFANAANFAGVRLASLALQQNQVNLSSMSLAQAQRAVAAQYAQTTGATNLQAINTGILASQQQAGVLTTRSVILAQIGLEKAQNNGNIGLFRKIGLTQLAKTADNSLALSSATATAQQNALTTASLRGAIAMGIFSTAVKGVMAAFGIFTLIFSVVSIFKSFRKGSDDASTGVKKLKDNLEDLNEVGNGTVAWIKDGLVVKVGIDTTSAADQKVQDALLEELGGTEGDFYKGLQKIVNDNIAGEEIRAIYAKTIIDSQFGNQTPEEQEAIQNILAQVLKITPEQIEKATAESFTGVKGADTILTRAYIESFTSAQKKIEEYGTDYGIQIPQVGVEAGEFDLAPTFTAIQDALRRYASGSAGYGKAEEIGNTISRNLGEGFTGGIQDSASVLSFTKGLENLLQDTSTLDATQQNKFIREFVAGTFEGLDGELDVLKDKTGNLAEIFTNAENRSAAIDLITGSLKTDPKQAGLLLDELQKKLEKVPEGEKGAAEAAQITAEFFNKQVVATNKLNASTVNVVSGLKETEDQFQDTASAVSDTIKEYDAATAAIKAYTEGQEALLGLNKGAVEAAIDYRESLGKIADSTGKVGSGLFAMTEDADEAQEAIIGAVEDLLAAANIKAAKGDREGAIAMIAAGSADIVSAGIAAGIDSAEIFKLFGDIGFGPEIAKAFFDSQELAANEGRDVGTAINNGMKSGLLSSEAVVSQAVSAQSQALLQQLKDFWAIQSPSKVAEKEIGIPIGEGIQFGLVQSGKNNKFANILGGKLIKSINNAIGKASEKSRGSIWSAFTTSFMKKKGDVKTPIQDYVKAVVSRMKEVIGSLGQYLNAQLDFSKAKTDLAKLANTQRLYESNLAKARRAQGASELKFGLEGGAQVTDYEQAQIDELQKSFEQASRDYALGRATLVDVVDAEIALQEARAAASETNADVIDSQNTTIDRTRELQDRNLEFAAAQVAVLESYADVIEASIELYWNSKELPGVFNQLAAAAGVTNGTLQIGGEKIADIGIKFDGLLEKVGLNLTDPEGEFATALQGLGPTMWDAIKASVSEAIAKSPLTLGFGSGGSGSGSKGGTPSTSCAAMNCDVGYVGALVDGKCQCVERPKTTSLNSGYVSPSKAAISIIKNSTSAKAVGGPILSGNPYLVGEKGPEMFLPNVSGTVVTASALERYTRVKSSMTSSSQQGSGNNIEVNVYNPTPEPAADSITRRMKVLSNNGLFG